MEDQDSIVSAKPASLNLHAKNLKENHEKLSKHLSDILIKSSKGTIQYEELMDFNLTFINIIQVL